MYRPQCDNEGQRGVTLNGIVIPRQEAGISAAGKSLGELLRDRLLI
jgi:hypothetical protein